MPQAESRRKRIQLVGATWAEQDRLNIQVVESTVIWPSEVTLLMHFQVIAHQAGQLVVSYSVTARQMVEMAMTFGLSPVLSYISIPIQFAVSARLRKLLRFAYNVCARHTIQRMWRHAVTALLPNVADKNKSQGR